MNKVILIGNLGTEPETKQVGESNLTKIVLATSRKWKNKAGEIQEKTEWHNVVFWNKLSDIAAKWLKKGSKIMIEGEINYNSYEKDGEKKYFTQITASNMEMLGSKNENSSPNNSAPQTKSEPKKEQTTENSPEGEADLPF